MTEAREETRDLTIGQALDLGVQFALAGNHESAVGLFSGVLMHEPENFEAIERLGSSFFELKRYHEALYWFWRGRKIDRKHPLALTNYGLCVSQLGHWEEGVVDLERAAFQAERKKDISIEAKSLVYNNLGNTYEKLRRYKDALVALDKSISINPSDHFPHYNRGIVLLRLNRHREGIDALNRSLSIKSNDPDAIYNRGMGRLLLGYLKGGFEDYEARMLTSENKVINLGLPADKKLKNIDQTVGARILVHCEQGIGDDIQFLRFLPELLKWTGKVVVICHSATRPFFEAVPGVRVMPTGANLKDEYDYWVPLMSLPLIFGIDHESKIPAPWPPPIMADRVEQWRRTMDLPSSTINVGVCWAGNFLHKNDAHRSIALEVFAKLFTAPGCTFVSLQQMRPGETETFAKLKEKHTNLRAYWFDDLRDTAAAMFNLDRVISVDTAVGHLAATLGVQTSILIPAFATDWRWQLERTDSPWYPRATLYRQQTIGDWENVITRLRNELTISAGQKRAA
jgi:tetratricopeptide (TPR) repeat protein